MNKKCVCVNIPKDWNFENKIFKGKVFGYLELKRVSYKQKYVLIDENKQALLIPFHWFDTYFKPIDDLRNQILNQIISNHP